MGKKNSLRPVVNIGWYLIVYMDTIIGAGCDVTVMMERHAKERNTRKGVVTMYTYYGKTKKEVVYAACHDRMLQMSADLEQELAMGRRYGSVD